MVLQYNKENHTLSGLLLQCDKSTVSGRTYPYDNVVPAVNQYRQLVTEGKSFGQFGIPTNNTIDQTHIAVLVTETHFKDKSLYGTLKILGTPNGKLIDQLINAGVRLRIAMCALGTVKHQTVSDLNIISFNVVGIE